MKIILIEQAQGNGEDEWYYKLAFNWSTSTYWFNFLKLKTIVYDYSMNEKYRACTHNLLVFRSIYVCHTIF